MKLEHIRIDLNNYIELNPELVIDSQLFQPVVLLDINADSDEKRVLAQVISLDIRGDFGHFLIDQGRPDKKVKQNTTIWRGSIFEVKINHIKKMVTIHNYTGEDTDISVSLSDWIEALTDWKEFYLTELGFQSFNSVALNHLFGVILLGADLLGVNNSNHELDTTGNDEELIEAIKMCADRFGVPVSDIYRDCKSVTGLYHIKDFYKWAYDLIAERNEAEPLCEFVMQRIDQLEPSFRGELDSRLGIAF